MSGVEGTPIVKASALPKGVAAQHLWNGARTLPRFTADELRRHSPVGDRITDDELRSFINLLLRARYAKIARKRRDADTTYRLIRNSGPLPPVEVRVRAVWDQNDSRIAHMPEVTP